MKSQKANQEEPWVKMARRFNAVYRERYGKETSVDQFEKWIKEACVKHAANEIAKLKVVNKR